ASAGRLDADAAKAYFASPAEGDDSDLGHAATDYVWGGGRLAGAGQAAPDEDAYDRVRTSNAETLLVGGALDFATPPQIATKELLPHLPHGHQVVLPGVGHTVSFWSQQPDAGTHLIETFLDTGRVDDSRYA